MVKQFIQKIFFIFLTIIILSFIITSATWGSITVKSTVNYKYNLWQGQDILDTILSFNGSINENANAYLSVEYQSNSNPPVNGIAYFTYNFKPQLGTITVGCFYESPGNVQLLGNSVDHLKSNFGFTLERPITGGLSAKIGCYPHEQKNYTFSNVYLIGLNYKDDHFRASLNTFKFESPLYPINYTANFLYKPNKLFRVYTHYGNKLDDSIDGILGVMLTIPPTSPSLNIIGEYNYNKPDIWGIGISYLLDKNIYLSYYRITNSNNYNELRLTITL